MKREVCFAVALAMLPISGGLSAQGISPIPAIQIQRDTLIAFYTPESKAANVDSDSNEALSDFQFYADRVKQPLSKINIDFKELYVRSFRLHSSGSDVVFRPKPNAVGYYLIAPGKKPHVEYGVMTDADLLLAVKLYFGLLENPAPVEVWCGGDDGLTLKVCDAKEQAFKAAQDLPLRKEEESAKYKVVIATNVDWKKVQGRLQILYTIDLLNTDDNEVGRFKGLCWESKVGACGTQILEATRSPLIVRK